jgi:hypothetical protein
VLFKCLHESSYIRMSSRTCTYCEKTEVLLDSEKARGVTKPVKRYRPVVLWDVILPLGNCTLAATVGGPSRNFRCARIIVVLFYSFRHRSAHFGASL